MTDTVSYFPHVFETQIVRHDVGSYAYTVVFLDPDIAPQLPFDQHSRLRMSGEINDIPFEAAWQPVRGRYYAMLSKPVLKAGDLALGDWVEVRFRLEDQEAVDVPADLRHALSADIEARDAFDALTAGKRRGLSIWIDSAKRAPTRAKRISATLDILHGREKYPWEKTKKGR
ncbi:MAG: YdeI/OmpD-associated family protein [Pseudomonadota bacterium]